jgi:hypothetical protein
MSQIKVFLVFLFKSLNLFYYIKLNLILNKLILEKIQK